MKLYRFSPIWSESELHQAVEYLHEQCHKLCYETMGRYLPVSGAVRVFCHDFDEFPSLSKLRESLTDANSNYMGKYFRLNTPIVIDKKGKIPGATYEFIYIRPVDPYRPQVGDIDFVLPADHHAAFRATLKPNAFTAYARNFERPDDTRIELWSPKKDILAYIVTDKMADLVQS